MVHLRRFVHAAQHNPVFFGCVWALYVLDFRSHQQLTPWVCQCSYKALLWPMHGPAWDRGLVNHATQAAARSSAPILCVMPTG